MYQQSYVTVVIEIVRKKGIKTSKLFMPCLTLFDLSWYLEYPDSHIYEGCPKIA